MPTCLFQALIFPPKIESRWNPGSSIYMQNCDRIPAISSFTMLLTLTNEFSSLEITKTMDPLNEPDFQVLNVPQVQPSSGDSWLSANDHTHPHKWGNHLQCKNWRQCTNWRPYKAGGLFCKSINAKEKRSTQCQPSPYYSQAQTWLCYLPFGWTHPTPPVPRFLPRRLVEVTS